MEDTNNVIQVIDEWNLYDHKRYFSKKARRIGSNSMRAMVIQSSKNGKQSACKLLFSTEQNPENKNLKEIYQTQKLGDKYPDYFPVVYGIETCRDIYIPENIRNQYLINDAEIWYIRTKILPMFLNKAQIKSMKVQYRNSNRQVYYNFMKEKNLKLELPLTMLYIELGDIDLNHWSKNEHTDEEWFHIIRNVLEALIILEKEDISHNNLHFDNIMFINGKVKIIDFGESTEGNQSGVDFEKFVDNFRSIPILPTKIKLIIQYFKNNLDKCLVELLNDFENVPKLFY